MGIDYVVDQPCQVKRTLSTDGMVALIRQRYRAVAAIEAVRRDAQPDEQAMGATFPIMLASPGGVRKADVKVSGLLAGTEKLGWLQKYCRGCPASAGKAFGCYRTLDYPVSRRAEEWLAATARNAAAKGGAAGLALDYIVEKDVDGGSVSRMRADPDGGFFELKRPLDIAIVAGTGPCEGKRVNTDQVLNLALGRRRIREARMKMLLLMTGGLTRAEEHPAPGTYQVAFRGSGEDGAVSWWAYRLDDGPGDDTSTRQLKQYFRMMALALALGRDMLVSR